MQISRSLCFTYLKAVLSAAARSRHSMFWKIVPTMFLACCAAAVVLNVGATIGEDARLRSVLAPASLTRSFDQAVRESAPWLLATDGPGPGCRDSLQVLAEQALAATMGDRTGDANANGFYRTVKAGRLVVSLRTASGHTCTFSSDERPVISMLRERLEASAARPIAAQAGKIVEMHEGWISVAILRPQGEHGPTLSVGVHVFSPLAKFLQPQAVLVPLATYIFTMNVLAALVIVTLLIQRIRRADEAAMAWTSGDLATRIHDMGQDEFSKLAQKFDMMADAMSGVIQVKQALAAAEERNRLARDLHDSAKQRAFALNLQLSAARGSVPPGTPGARLLEAALSLTSQLQQDLASVIRRLGAPTIAESGFRHVLTEGIETLLTGSQIICSISLDDEDETLLAELPEVERQLFLITLEAVANALKHAQCTQCVIAGKRDGTGFVWRIEDNGTGWDSMGTRSQGMGLANMKLRADGLPGGRLDILTGDGGGAVIVVTFRLTTGE